MPAVEKGDKDAADNAYLQMTEVYREHRAAIDEVVKLAKQRDTDLELSAAEREHTILSTIAVLTAIVVGFVVACIIGAISWVVGPIVRMQDAMRRIAGGNLETRVPSLNRKDEIGQMAGAVQVFQSNALDRSKLNREAQLLSELNEWLQSCKSLDELYQMVAEFLSRLLPDCAGSLYIYANSRDILESAKAWNGGHATAAMHPDDCWGLRRGRTYAFGDSEISFPCAHVGAAKQGDIAASRFWRMEKPSDCSIWVLASVMERSVMPIPKSASRNSEGWPLFVRSRSAWPLPTSSCATSSAISRYGMR